MNVKYEWRLDSMPLFISLDSLTVMAHRYEFR